MSTAHRMLLELMQWGAVERTAAGTYHLGEQVWQWGVATPWERELRTPAARHAHALARQTGVAVSLNVLTAERLVCLEAIPGQAKNIVQAQTGQELPLLATSSGKILLAGSAGDRVTAALRQGVPRLTPFTPTTPKHILSQLDKARRDGYATAHAEIAIGLATISVPVDTGTPLLPMAVTLLVPAPAPELTKLAQELRETAARISAAIESVRN